MPGTDFFDDDLVRKREAGGKIRMAPQQQENPVETLGSGDRDEVPVRPVSDFNLTRMAKYKAEVTEQTTAAMQELERLKKRQEQLEKEKRDLEELQHKHDDFDRGKREMLDHLKRSLVSLERQEMEAGRLAEMLSASRKRFKQLQTDLEDIKEENWAENEVRENLGKALGVIEEARMEFNKSMAKIEAVKGEGGKGSTSPSSGGQTVLFEDHAYTETKHNLAYWMKVGFAVSLPVVITLIIMSIVIYMAVTRGGF